MKRLAFSRRDLERMAEVLGIEPAGLNDPQLLDAVHAELARRKAALRACEPAGLRPPVVHLRGRE